MSKSNMHLTFMRTETTTTVAAAAMRAPSAAMRAASAPGGDDVVDVVLSFDTTGSMYPFLAELRARLTSVVTQLAAAARTHKHTIRVGVLAHGDYCDKASSYVTKFLPLHDVADGATLAKLTSFIGGVGPTGGGDGPECYELALHKVRTSMHWAPKSRRMLVIVGDNDPHPVGYTCNGYTNTLDWQDELAQLAKMRVRVYAVEAGGGAHGFWGRCAAATRGAHLPIGEIATVPRLILAAALKEVSPTAFDAYGAELTRGGHMRGETQRTYETIRRVVTTTTTMTSVVVHGGKGAAAALMAAGVGRGAGAAAGTAALSPRRAPLALTHGGTGSSSGGGGGGRGICRFFNAGKCSQAAGACPFEHVKVCRFFNTPRGCRQGGGCSHRHVTVCRDFNNASAGAGAGGCAAGKACPHLHIYLQPAGSTAAA